jgi:hypothetical protein
MAPVPAKAVRLSELEDADRTAYFSVTALMERGKAVAARSETLAAESLVVTEPPPPPAAAPGFIQQLREASLARKATLVVLPLLLGLLALDPSFGKPAAAVLPPRPSATQPPARPQHVAESDVPARLAPTPAEPPPALPKGVALERAASDALAGGDFQRALGSYRELSRREPGNVAYREAARILERRTREKQP